MSRERQAAALLALGVVAAALGFGGAAWLDGRGEPPPPPAAAAAVPAAPPEEALLEPPAPAAEPAEPPAVPPPEPVPEPEPERTAAPAPAPEPRSEPPAPAVPNPRPAPQPPSPPPPPVDPPAAPPTGVAIPAAEAPTGYEPARRELATALASAAPGSAEEADIRRGLALWSAYLAPGAPPSPAGRRATVARALRANAWWFARRPSPGGRVLLRDPDGVILTYRRGQGFAVNPVATTGRWRGLNDDVPPEALAATLLEMGVERAAGDRRFLAWEYYDVADDPAAIRPGASAMAQARVALLMAHGAARTGDPRLERRRSTRSPSFVVLVDRGGVRTLVATAAGQAPGPLVRRAGLPGREPLEGRRPQRLHGHAAQPARHGRGARPGAGRSPPRPRRPSPSRATSPTAARRRSSATSPTTTRAPGATTACSRPGAPGAATSPTSTTTATTCACSAGSPRPTPTAASPRRRRGGRATSTAPAPPARRG